MSPASLTRSPREKNLEPCPQTFAHAMAPSTTCNGALAALRRWSCVGKQLPPIEQIKALHVYDFDNTLFRTPLPNATIWSRGAIGMLCNADTICHGGWWHDNRILAATARRLGKQGTSTWGNWWNERVVQLAELSIKQPDVLCVLLTGRSESEFADLIKKMIASKGLDFDMVCLKPTFSPTNEAFQSTLHFKKSFIDTLAGTYKEASEIRLYEDRLTHTQAFRDFFVEYNRLQCHGMKRKALMAEVVQVAEKSISLDPVIEVAEVQRMINEHNEAQGDAQSAKSKAKRLELNRLVTHTAYLMDPKDTERIMALADIPSTLVQGDLKHHANSIIVSVRSCLASTLEMIGGLGSKLLWEVTGIGSLDNSVWAARVRPVPPTASHYTIGPVPHVVLAVRKKFRTADAAKITHWKPLPPNETIIFETTLGEKSCLRIRQGFTYDDKFDQPSAKRPFSPERWADSERPSRRPRGAHHGDRNGPKGFHRGGRRGRAGYSARGNRHLPRACGAAGGSASRGRSGAAPSYRSLDDVGSGATRDAKHPDIRSFGAFPSLSHVPAAPHGQAASTTAISYNAGPQAPFGSLDLQTFY